MDVPIFNGNHEETCHLCFGRGILLCCDYCPLAYHTYCIDPIIISQPEDYWMCPECQEDLSQEAGVHVIRTRCQQDSCEPKPDHVHVKGENGNKKGHIFTSGFRGVYSRGDKWNAQIQYNGKKVYLGSYSSEEEAARAYDIAAKRYHGSKAILNFHSHENGCIRNPYQVNSKPTSRKDSFISNEYAEVNQDGCCQSRTQSLTNEEENCCTPIFYMENEESKKLIMANRKDMLSYL